MDEKDKGRVAALYERLSHDDEHQASNSIINQKDLLEKAAAEHGYRNIRHYTDDGFSGGNFDRPAWNRMLADIEAGGVGAVLVKDMSRIGRDYLQVGFYTEVVFPRLDVRFIAVASGVDSERPESNEFAPFLNVLNEWYLRDNSRKIRTAIRAKAMAGKPIANQLPYGYVRDPADKDIWKVDEESAATVRRIFRLYLDGLSEGDIAKKLSDEHIPTPSYYRVLHSANKCIMPKYPFIWNSRTIGDILGNQAYIGNTVNYKTRKVSYKGKKQERLSPSEWEVREGTHTPVIDGDTWSAVQEKRSGRRAVHRDIWADHSPLEPLVFCADCGSKMYRHRQKAYPVRDRQGRLTGKQANPQDYLLCAANTLAVSRGLKACSRHHVRLDDLEALVLALLREVSEYAIADEGRFLARLQGLDPAGQQINTADSDKQAARLNCRFAELDDLIQKTYEGFFTGTISDQEREALVQRYEAEQEEVSRKLQAVRERKDHMDDDARKGREFIRLSEQYRGFPELTAEVAGLFIDRILVHEADWCTGKKEQEVEVFFKFIGDFRLPQPEVSPEEAARRAAERERMIRKRAKQVEYCRRWNAAHREGKEVPANE